MVEEFVKTIKEKMQPPIRGFSINRIPKKGLRWFINFAKEEFEDDRGFALKHLIDFYNGLIPSGVEHLEQAFLELKQELDSVKEQIKKTEEEPKVKKTMMDGSTIKE